MASSRPYIQYHTVPTEEEDEEQDEYYDECFPGCCPLRFRGHSQRSNNRFYGIQGSQQRVVDSEPVAQTSRGGGSLMRWSVASASGTSGSGSRRRRSDTASETNGSAGRQSSLVAREPARSEEVTRSPPNYARNSPINSFISNNNTVHTSNIVAITPVNRVHTYERPPRADAQTIASFTRDVFIIPIESVDRFFPAHIPRPFTPDYPANLAMYEIDDPKQCIIIHLMSHFKAVDPLLESPLMKPLSLQKETATDLLVDISHVRMAYEGLVLNNMESSADFPVVSFFVLNKNDDDPFDLLALIQRMTYEKYDATRLRYTANHTLDIFNEVATIARPPLTPGVRRPLTKSTGYIVSVYKVFDGDDGPLFEQNWLAWTGARLLYNYLPLSVGLRRITLHKSVTPGDKTYVMLCECANFMNELSAVTSVIPAMRGRLCGCTGLYRAAALF